DEVVVNVLPRIQVSVSANNPLLCGGGIVSFSANVSNATGQLSYFWNFGNGSSSNLPNPQQVYNAPGTYQVYLQVTDSNGCTAGGNTTILVNNLITSVSSTNATCFAANNGSVTVVATGGQPPYSYFWSNGMVGQVGSNLSAGTYSLTVTDAAGCSASAMATLTEPTQLTAATTVINESTTGSCDGSIVLTVNGGTPPYTFLWSNNATTANITNLCAGTYTATISDANACTATAGSVIGSGSCTNNTLVVSINSQTLSCSHPTDTLTVNVSGGTAPYTFLWSTIETTASIIVSDGGVYQVIVSDTLGCTRAVSDTIVDTGVSIALASSTPVSCNGVNDGKIKVAVTGGTPPYTFVWNTDATADSITGIPSGQYSVTVSDAGACVDSFSYYLPQTNTNWSYYVYTNQTEANCNANGTATAYPYGGTPPFSYNWSNGGDSATITGLVSGFYTVTVTGADGCIRTGNTFVSTSCYNIISGRLIRDINGNCVLDSGETGFASQSIIADGTPDYHGYTNAQGYFTIQVPAGTYSVRPYYTDACLVNCSPDSTHSYTFAGLGDTVSNANFYLVPAPFDLYVNQAGGAFRPGFTRTINLYYGNIGFNTVNATLTYTYDADLTFVSVTGGGVHNAGTRTITWALNNLPGTVYSYNYYGSFVSADFLTPVGTPVGTSIINTARISGPSGECDSTDNTQTSTQAVTNSYDPNEKEVMPAGDIYDETTSQLTYTIHFQNTGNDTAWFVILKDTLSSYLEPASVVNIAGSHTITDFSISQTGILTWVFNPIYLVDSATNPEGSKGYVSFRVNKKAGLPIGTEIKNTAHIYFDYNDAVVTNTVNSRIADPNSIPGVNAGSPISVFAAPNPFTQSTQLTVAGVTGAYNFELFDVSGKQLKQINNITSPRFEIDRDGISAGVYFYSITTINKQKAYGRLVVN
nr:T9SS type A sorting domain-containing protein [Chitinophagales bacterium]